MSKFCSRTFRRLCSQRSLELRLYPVTTITVAEFDSLVTAAKEEIHRDARFVIIDDEMSLRTNRAGIHFSVVVPFAVNRPVVDSAAEIDEAEERLLKAGWKEAA